MGAREYQERNEANWMKFWMATMETFIKNQKKEDMQSWGDVFNFGYVQFNTCRQNELLEIKEDKLFQRSSNMNSIFEKTHSWDKYQRHGSGRYPQKLSIQLDKQLPIQT